MSKKTDFTQKLLTDLRLRKQRLAAAQTVSSDGPDNLYRPYQGQGRQGEINIHKTKAYQPSHGRRKPVAVEEFSTDIVPIRAAQSREYITDLSMALAFALENGGRVGNIQFLGNSVMQKASLHLGQRRSVGLSSDMSGKFMTERNQQLVPSRSNLSHIRITEVSKGAQRLNQILKACSQGLRFDGYSIEIGKELLKGAVDLEESLRMLVSLQEASQSQFMVSPQRKHRVQLREVDEDEEAEIQEKVPKFPEKPRFSFDKSSRNSKAHGSRENKKTSIPPQKLPVRRNDPNPKTHQPETDGRSIAILNSVSHKGSVSSYLPNGRRNVLPNKPSNPIKSTPPVMITANNSAPATSSKNGSKMKQSSSQASPEQKARIPNVIAKLMGLEEVPLKTDSKGTQRVQDIRRWETSKREKWKYDERGSIRQVDAVISNYEKPVPQITQQLMVVPANRIAATRNTTIATVQNKSTLKGNFERINFYVDPQTRTPHVDQYQTQFAKMERQGRETTKHKDQLNPGKSEHAFSRARGPVSTTEFEKHRDYKEAAYSENIGMKRTVVQKPFKNDRLRTPMGDQQEFKHERESTGPSVAQKSESNERDIEEKKSKQQVTEARKTHMVSKTLQKQMPEANIPKKMLQRNQNMVTSKKGSIQAANATRPKEDESSIHAESNTRKSAQSREEKTLVGQRNDTGKAATMIQLTEPMKMTNMRSIQKAVVTEAFEAQECKMKQPEETKNRMDVYPQENAQRKQKTSMLQDVKKIRQEQIMKAKELEHIWQQKNFLSSTSCDHAWDDGERQKETEEITADHARNDQRQKETKESTTSCHHCINTKGPTELPAPEISLGGDHLSDLKAIQSKGTRPKNNAIGNSNAVIEQLQPHAKPEKQGRSLTKQEKHLKEILLNSQHFLNAAEALFRLQIPIEILHNSHNKHQMQSNHLMLDCAYEIMKRKGEQEELVFRPSVGLPIASIKAKCLDDLVKILHEDMEDLKFHGDSGGATSNTTAAHLQGLLKADVQDRNGDVNCMWDLGWNRKTLAYLEKDEVVKDAEKHILNRLIDEAIGDLLHISIGKI